MSQPDFFLSQYGPLELYTVDVLESVQHIYVDTCFIMHPCFDLFLIRYAPLLAERGIKLRIIPQVLQELRQQAETDDDEERKLRAETALSWISSGIYGSIFHTVFCGCQTPIADRAFFYEFMTGRYARHQCLLTNDRELTAAIYNACCHCRSQVLNYQTFVLTLHADGSLARYGAEKLQPGENVKLPAWPMVVLNPGEEAAYGSDVFPPVPAPLAPAAPPETLRFDPKSWYIYDCIANGLVYIDSAALSYAHKKATAFIPTLRRSGAWRVSKIHVLSVSLQKPAWREWVQSMPDLFVIEENPLPDAGEEDALFYSLFNADISTSQVHHTLLITNALGRYERLASRQPLCFERPYFWGRFISRNGTLKKTALSRVPPAGK